MAFLDFFFQIKIKNPREISFERLVNILFLGFFVNTFMKKERKRENKCPRGLFYDIKLNFLCSIWDKASPSPLYCCANSWVECEISDDNDS
jgi:hypothetical protein